MGSKKMIPLDEAKREVEAASRRIALLHLSYAKTLIEELGEERGIELIRKAIEDYGTRIGEKTREDVLKKGLPPDPKNFSAGESLRLPRFGMCEKYEVVEVGGELRRRVHGCILAKLWREYGEERIGRLYCDVDVAKYRAYNPDYELIHLKTLPDGDEYCEFVVRPAKGRKERGCR